MLGFQSFRTLYFPLIAASVIASTGCRQLPGSPKQQGAVIGGLGGAAAGAAIGGEHNRVLGAILGGALGAGGGYVVGANSDRILHRDRDAAEHAMQTAQTTPATPEQARVAATADLNNDGFVTLDEVVAMRRAGLSDDEMLRRLQATGQVFEFTPEQQRYLQDNGVSGNLVSQMSTLNRDVRDRIAGQSGVVGHPAP